MQPHDVIYHYGVPGMRWGRRKAAYVSRKLAAGKRRDQEASRSIAKDLHENAVSSRAKARSSKNLLVKGAYTLDSKYAKGLSKNWYREADRDGASANRHAQRAAKLEASLNRPMKAVNSKRNERIFEKAVGTIVIGTAGALTVALLRPTANAFGEQLASHITRKVANRSGDIFRYTMKL